MFANKAQGRGVDPTRIKGVAPFFVIRFRGELLGNLSLELEGGLRFFVMCEIKFKLKKNSPQTAKNTIKLHNRVFFF